MTITVILQFVGLAAGMFGAGAVTAKWLLGKIDKLRDDMNRALQIEHKAREADVAELHARVNVVHSDYTRREDTQLHIGRMESGLEGMARDNTAQHAQLAVALQAINTRIDGIVDRRPMAATKP